MWWILYLAILIVTVSQV